MQEKTAFRENDRAFVAGVRLTTIVACLLFALGLYATSIQAAGRWGADYFPNVTLVTSEGNEVRFFDDLIRDRIVAINFIYTSCADTCPLETAQLVRVQKILGERLGREIFFYSISIDPEHDTPQVLAEYKERFGARWTFLTGDAEDITALRKKLGLFIPEIQDGSNNHNVNMIIGNQATGRWMKRSPFENPHVLAEQIGGWLADWKSPPRGQTYEHAPELRNISAGERLFRTRCASCHSINGHEAPDALGPDLLGVTQRRNLNWLLNWLKAPDQMLAKKDPIAMALYRQYDELAMPNMRLNQQDAMDLIQYMNEESVLLSAVSGAAHNEEGDEVFVSNVWVREAHPGSGATAAYMTLFNPGPQPIRLVEINSDWFESIEVHEMARVDGLMEMRRIEALNIPANGQVVLAPGGLHLMMRGPRSDLTAGDRVDLKLDFSSGASLSIEAQVAAR